MEKAIKDKWIDELKSGNFTKGSGYLRHDNRYCCLGVLCEINKELLGKDWVNDTFGGDRHYISETDSLALELPLDIRNELAAINDRTSSFDEVVIYIQEKL